MIWMNLEIGLVLSLIEFLSLSIYFPYIINNTFLLPLRKLIMFLPPQPYKETFGDKDLVAVHYICLSGNLILPNITSQNILCMITSLSFKPVEVNKRRLFG